MSTPPAAPVRNNWWVVVATAVVTAMGSFDLFGVNIVLPGIADEFGIEPTLSQWVVIAYILPITALALPMGRWLDTVGRRSAMIFLVAGFMVASLLVGLSPTAEILVGTRVLQGIFGAGVFASTTVLAFEAVGPGMRNRAIAITGTVSPLGAIAGPSLGALLANALGWRSIFFVNVIVGVLALLVFILKMGPDARLRLPGRDILLEVLLLGTATAVVLIALSVAPEQGPAWYLIAVPALPLALAWWLTNRRSTLVSLMRVPGQLASLLAVGAFSAVGIAAQYLLSFFGQDYAGLSVVDTGLALLAVSAFSAVTGPLGGYLADRFSPGPVALSGLALTALAIASFTPLTEQWGVADIALRAALLGIGQGLTMGPTVAITMGFGAPSVLASASAALQFVRNFGFVAGPVVATAAWAASGYTTTGMSIALWGGVGIVVLSILLMLRALRSMSRGTAL